jgi:uncharacterized membrane protein
VSAELVRHFPREAGDGDANELDNALVIR